MAVVVPPMGASPLSCVIEDLAARGVSGVFLVCAAWSLGPPVQLGDLIAPSFSVGPDGTSIHYGNEAARVEADRVVVEALAAGARHIAAGILFQSYIDLSRGWDPARLDTQYETTCRLQAVVVLDAAAELARHGRFRPNAQSPG